VRTEDDLLQLVVLAGEEDEIGQDPQDAAGAKKVLTSVSKSPACSSRQLKRLLRERLQVAP
jgi:hypothetical protein